MSTSKEYKEGASKSNIDDVCEVNDKLQKLSTADVSVCANCGKEGANNTCNKCRQVRYCNAVCKKVHKKKHKKDCEEHIRLAAEKHNEELRIAAELYDEKLFKQPPPTDEDCPICFLRMPSLGSGRTYFSCCGMVICNGCVYAPLYDNQGNEVDNKKCPFCRTPNPATEEEAVERGKKRVEMNDPIAIGKQGRYYRDGTDGFTQDYGKALELWHQAGELGYSAAYYSIGVSYSNGRGVEVDEKKAVHYTELGAMRGCVIARCNLGNIEGRAGNTDRALKHYMIAIRSGNPNSLESIKELYSKGYATKGDYITALRSYQDYLGEIKSDQRDKAAEFDEDYRYY